MSKALTRTVRLVSLAAIAVSVAACEPDEEARRNLSSFSLAQSEGPFDLGLQDAGLGGGIGDLLPAALPLLAGGGGDYGLAPSWDYARGDYVDYAPGDPYDYYGYDEPYYDDGYHDDGYYDDAGYYDESAGSSDFMWLALAALIASVIGDSPPDYGFDHYGVQPWAWRTGDGYYRVVEPIYGGNRYYYYAPGAGQPFLVRDPYFSYGYRDDRLVALYDRDGRLMDERAAQRQRKAAQQYLARSEALYRAARADARTGVAVRDWEQRRGALAGDQRRWREAKVEQVAWRQWNKQYERGLRERWQRESTAREQATQRVESWREASYRGPAPRLYARERGAEVQRVAIVQPRGEARRARTDQRQGLVQRREAQRDTVRPQVAQADGRQRARELTRERNGVSNARIAAAEQSRRRDLAVQREERTHKARGERQQRAARQDLVRAERQAAQRQQQVQARQVAQQQQRAAREEQARAERQASAERQQRAQQERARAAQQAARRQQQEQARQVAQEQQRQQQQAREAQRAAQQAAAAARPAATSEDQRGGGRKTRKG
jgi:hypothetical protein